MEIRNLKTFAKIAQLGSFTKAAHAMGYAQSTLTFQVQSIEAYYGRPIFEKIGKNVRLTAFGAKLLEETEPLLRQYEQIEQIGKENEMPQGSIRIGAPESLMMYRLYPIIKAYKAAYPQVELSVINSPCEHLREHLCSGELDLSFLLQPELDSPNLCVFLLKEEKMCLAAPAGHANENMLPEPTQMVLYTEKECTYRQEYELYLRSQGFAPVNVLETASVEAIKKYIMSGLGVSYLPYYAVEEEAAKGLIRIALPEAQQRFYTQIAHHKKKWLSPAMKAFLSLCCDCGKKWHETEKMIFSVD